MIKYSEDVQNIQDLYEKVNVLLRSLKAIGVKPELYKRFLDQLIIEKLPNDLMI